MNEKAQQRTDSLFQGIESNFGATDPEWVEIVANFSQAEAAGESRLTEKERMLCILSALLGCQGAGRV